MEILGITGASASGTDTIRPHASAVQVDISPDPEVHERKYHLTAQLTPSGILTQPKSQEFHFTGEIKQEVLEPGEVVAKTELGDIRAMEYYQWHERTENANRVRVQVERAALTGEVTLRPGQSMASLHDEVATTLNDICDMLSLCYRDRVSYYEISYFELEPRTDPITRSPLLRRKLKPVARDKTRHDLINFRDLTAGGLDSLYQAYRSHPAKTEIGRAIRLVAGSYSTDGLEHSYFLAYTALETAIGAASDDTIEFALGSSLFRKLCRHLRGAVTDFAAERQLTDLSEEIADKLPELRRRSTKRKMERVRAKLALRVDDLWPHLGFDDGFARATRSRNDLVHTAVVAQPEQLFRDRVRISLLAERIVLKLLGWPDEKMWVWHDQEVRWVNKDEGAVLTPLVFPVA